MITERILVDLDPGKPNRAAIDRSALLAEATGASIELFVSDYQHWLAGGPASTDTRVSRSRESYLDEMRAWADDLAVPLVRRGLVVVTTAAWQHPRYDALIRRAEETGADLIVRVASQHSRIARLFLTATDWELIRRAPQALWLVQGEQPVPKRGNILAAVDPGHPDQRKAELDEHVVGAAVALQRVLGGDLRLFNAYVPPTAVTSVPIAAGAGASAAPVPRVDEDLVDAVRDMHASRLRELAGRFDIDRAHTQLAAGDAAREIAEAVEKEDIGIVVVGALSRNWLQRWLVGSTTESVFNAVDCDVFVVKLEDNEEEEGGKDA